MDQPDDGPRHHWRPALPPHKRGYGHQHRKIRRALLREEPFCRECKKSGAEIPATHADHIEPRCLGGSDERENYQPLCAKHSRQKSAREGAHYRWHVMKKGEQK